MANYYITRKLEGSHLYGCTNFSTNQQVGQEASLAPNAQFDATIEWDINASSGYTIDVYDFSIPNTSVTTPTAITPGQFGVAGVGLPAFVTGVLFTQKSSTLIRVLIFLHPSSTLGFTGSPYEMPDNNVNELIDIEGCAKLKGEGIHVQVNSPGDDVVVRQAMITEGVNSKLVLRNETKEQTSLSGTLDPTVVGEKVTEEQYIMSYNVSVPDGYMFTTNPSLDYNTSEYYIKKEIQREESKINNSNNIIGTTFNIYKKQ